MSYHRKVWLGVFLFCLLFWSGIIATMSMLKKHPSHSAPSSEQISKAEANPTRHSPA
ncbi:hypothetical protein ACQKDS_04430 [Serratia sp. NPDC078593]|uniref:hypothetical protein n=1 Tax=unclassified Serratia (in: enterobacteria) TaxID=2647522 RepID=UPI0037D5B92C